MSDVVIKLIPEDPEFVPVETKLGEIKEWIAVNAAGSEKTEYILTDEVRFIDQGENFESISCPCCSSNIEVDWWSEAMDKAAEESFHNLQIIVECCNNDTSLNELHYKWNAGFSRFSIEIMNPRYELTEQNIEYLGQVLSCKIRTVVAFY